MTSPIAVVIDFDGTLTTRDIGDSLVKRFALPGWEDAMPRFRSGELGIRELWEREISHLPVERLAEMTQYALSVATPRQGLRELLGYAAKNGVVVEIASNGMDFYVDAILEDIGLSDLPRAAIRLAQGPDGKPGFAFAEGVRECPRTGLCKCDRVWRQRREGRSVIYVGDGISDLCVADQSDLVMARGSLAAHCKELGIRYRLFDDFYDVLEQVKAFSGSDG